MGKIHDFFFGKESKESDIKTKYPDIRFYNYKCRVCGRIISIQKYCKQDSIYRPLLTTFFKDEHRCPFLDNELDNAIVELQSVTVAPIGDDIIYLEENNKE